MDVGNGPHGHLINCLATGDIVFSRPIGLNILPNQDMDQVVKHLRLYMGPLIIPLARFQNFRHEQFSRPQLEIGSIREVQSADATKLSVLNDMLRPCHFGEDSDRNFLC